MSGYTFLIPLPGLLVFCFLPGTANAGELDDLVKTGREIISVYSLKMQTDYESAFGKNDPLSVKKVCAKSAKVNADGIEKNGWEIHRITFNGINVINTPDQTEARVLKDFQDKLAEGKEADKLAWYQLREVGNQSEFRYIRAFTLEERCMTCHGDKKNPDVNFPGLAAYSVRKIEHKHYLPDDSGQSEQELLPDFRE